MRNASCTTFMLLMAQMNSTSGCLIFLCLGLITLVNALANSTPQCTLAYGVSLRDEINWVSQYQMLLNEHDKYVDRFVHLDYLDVQKLSQWHE